MHILLGSPRATSLREFTLGLGQSGAGLIQIASRSDELLNLARNGPLHLAVIDEELDADPFSLVRELLLIDAAINTAVISSLSPEDFETMGEGLGIVCALPSPPGAADAKQLLEKTPLAD